MLPLNAAPKPICVARLREVARLSLRSVVVGLSDADSDEFSNIERDAVGVFYGETWHVCMALRAEAPTESKWSPGLELICERSEHRNRCGDLRC
ncbi:hypothetical protein ABBQ38_007744 [Trebouxia sp. C0009 RCD-2024]